MTAREAIDVIRSECYVFNPLNFDKSTMINTALDMAVNALKIDEMYNLEYENDDEFISKSVLDKIRAEIEAKCCITVGRENDGAITLHDIFEILDKYKAESEVQDADCD